MTATINASTSSGLVQTADTSGALALQSNGTTQFTIDSTGAYGTLERATAVASTSGTAVTIVTNLPSWVRRVTVMIDGVSTNGTSNLLFQLGTGAGPTYVATGYLGAGSYVSSSPSTANYTTGFGVVSTLAVNVLHGAIVFTNISGNTWVASGTFGMSNNNVIMNTAGSVALGAALTAIQITTVGGANTFDAGSINTIYEG